MISLDKKLRKLLVFCLRITAGYLIRTKDKFGDDTKIKTEAKTLTLLDHANKRSMLIMH